MPYYICITCGTQHAASDQPPPRCAICEDERQFVNWGGQQWTTLERLRERHRIVLRREDPGLEGVGIEPAFAIGQRALLVRTASGNVLWDCIPLIDGAIADAVQGLGGIRAIAISHPHYYSAMVEWSEACDGAPIYLHAADRAWVMRSHPAIRFWEGERHDLGPGLTLIRCGGHFAGGAVLHWAGGASGQGALLAGDILQVTEDRRYVSFMYSYPNYIPLGGATVRHILASLEPFAYEHVYGAWWDRKIVAGGRDAVLRSGERYLKAITAGSPP